MILSDLITLTHNVGLSADGDQTVDVLTDGHQHFTSHVPALLRARSLVLNVDTGSASLDEKLGQFHDRGQTTVASVGVRDDGSEVVNVGHLVTLVLWGGDALLTLLPVVEELGHEELVDLVGHGVLGVYCQPGTAKKTSPLSQRTMG